MLEEIYYYLGDGLLDLGLALLVLAAAWLVARLLGALVRKVVARVGDERIAGALGVSVVDEHRAPSQVAASVARAAIWLFAVVEACEIVGFEQGAELVSRFLAFGGDVLLGVAILALGLYLGRLAGDAVFSGTGSRFPILAPLARGAVIVLAIFMALDQMGIAEQVVQLLFVFTVGAVAVAAALAFGLGCRERAGRLFDEWLASWRGEDEGGSS